MSYIGNDNITQGFIPAIDYFSGNGSTVAFTLSRPVASVAQVQANISNVPQNPSSAFSVSGNTITFTSAPPSGTNNIYVYYTSPITQVIAPGQGTVTTTSLAGGTISTTADITSNGLTVGRGAGAVSTNTAVGANALAANTSGANNTAVGQVALDANTTGSLNVAFGVNTLGINTTGSENSAIGVSALSGNTTGSYNTALGRSALDSNTTASNNTAVGYQAAYSQQTGIDTTAVGYRALYTATGLRNTAIGKEALYSLTTGTNNTAIGESAGYSMTTGSKNTILGSYSGNQGGLDIRTASNYIVLSDGDGNIGMSLRYISTSTADIRPGQSNHAISFLGASGSINSGSSASININGYGGDGSGGFILATTAASDGSLGYDSTNMTTHTHGNGYNTYGTLSVYSSVNSITITNPMAGVTVITNNSGKTIKYQTRYLNLGSKAITLA